MINYKCLVLDHDDTLVDSTKEIHYKSFVDTLKILRPGMTVGFEEFQINCFNPGFYTYLEKKLHFNDDEMAFQLERWLNDVNSTIPSAFDGIKEIIHTQIREGGLVCVVSHSYPHIIERDFAVIFNCKPNLIFGSDLERDKRKPSVYPLEAIQSTFNLSKKDMVVIDDLKPGRDMAYNFGCDFIGAGWSHGVIELRQQMKSLCDVYLETVDQLRGILFK